MAGPFKLPTKENQDAEKLKRDSINKVKHWAELYIPAEVLQTRDCIVDVSEIQCGDPNCAPIDTVVRLLFKGNVGCVFGLPFEAREVTQEILDEQMPPDDYIQGWIDGREDLEWPPGPEMHDGDGPPEDVELRFGVDERVECCIGKGDDGWAAGTIVALWYRHPTWGPRDYAPYQIQLDDHDGLIFAPQDSDACIRLLQDSGAGEARDMAAEPLGH